MKGQSWKMGGMLLGLVTLGIFLLSGTTASAEPQYAFDCTKCHTMPPKDSHIEKPANPYKKDPFTGAVPGRHQSHADATANSCAKCHGDVSGYGNSHRDKVIQFRDTLGYGRKPVDPGFMNQTSVPPNPMASCSTAACHSNGKGAYRATPAWNSVDPASCSTCHDAAPTTNKHSTHITTYGFGCVKCHSDHSAEGKPFQHATSAGGRNIDVHFTAAPNSGGTFTPNANQALASCSAIYCHSDGKASPTYATPTWGGTADCTSCHGNATSGTLSGKHAQHVNNAGFLVTNYGCVDCHASTVSDNTTIAKRADHVSGFVNLSGATVPKSGTAAGTVTSCSAVYCHSDGKGTFKNISWTAASSQLTCNACHGSNTGDGSFVSATGMPNYSSLGAGTTMANSHKKHVSALTDCVKCHNNTVTAAGALTGTNHTNKFVEVSGAQISYNSGDKTCSTNTCHSGGGIIASPAVATWGGKLGCAGCHGDASTLASNAHAKHLAKNYSCDTCHNPTVSGSTTIINAALHGNSFVNVGGTQITTFTAEPNKTCATACHLTAQPQWANASTGACGTCHKAYSDTANGQIDSNAHTAHFSAAYGPGFNGATAGDACVNCHIVTNAAHVNSSVDLAANVVKSVNNYTCGDCHKQSAGTNWTTGRVSCESCHSTAGGALSTIGVIAPDKTLAATAGHGGVSPAQGCTQCHSNTGAHISGTLGDNTRLLAALGSGNTNCTYCHNDAAKVTNEQKRITQVHDGFANKCSACHDPHGTTNSKMVLANLSTVTVATFNGSNFVTADGKGVCQACHIETTYYKRNVAETNHFDTSTNCLECHSHKGFNNVKAFEPNRACDSCHGYPPAPRSTTYAVTFGVQNNWSSARFEDYSGGGGAHVVAAHLAKTVKPSDGWAPCLTCHQDSAASHAKAMPMRNHVENVTVKIDQQYRFSNDYFAVYTTAKLFSGGVNKTGGCFNVSCHFTTSPKWSTERY